MTTVELPRAAAAKTRSRELILARTHLRLGSLALARTELETLAGLDRLDAAGLVDLAEARWRTGDLPGAGEAATAALEADHDDEDPIALVIAAEAASSIGRPSEARRLALRAMAGATGSIDVLFAGMPRSAVWPADADEPPPTAPTLFDRAPEPPGRSGRQRPAPDDAPGSKPAAPAPNPPPVAVGFWDEDSANEGEPDEDVPDPAHELELGRAAVVAGDIDAAALRFAVAVRLAPALAPAVLEATAGARAASLMIVRGDAYRLTGHDEEAREAFLIASRGGLPERRKRPRTPLSREPAPAAPSPSDDGTSAAAGASATKGRDAPSDAQLDDPRG